MHELGSFANGLLLLIRLLGFQWIAIGVQGLISLVLGVLVARSFGPEMFGIYSVALSVGVFLAILIDGGFGNLLQREAVSLTPDTEFDGARLHGYAIGQALMAIAGLLVFVLLVPLPFHRPTLLAVICAFGVAVIGQFFLAILRGQGRLARDALWQLVNRGLSAVCVLAVLWWGATQPWEVLAAQCIGSAAFVFYLIHLQRVKPLFPVPLNVYRAMLPMVWLNLVSVIYSRADMVLLKLLDVPRSDIGFYGVAYRMMELVLLLAAPIGLMLFRYFRLGDSGVPFSILRILRPAGAAALIGLIALGMFAIFGKYVIIVAFGEAFSPAATLLSVLAVSLIFALANGVLFQAALAFGMERWCAIGATVAALGNVSANILMVPRHGVLAAAWITVATEIVAGIFLLYGLLLKRQAWVIQVEAKD